MNISVNAAHLSKIARIEQLFGLPTPRDQFSDELFGLYHMTDGEGCLFYDGKQQELTYQEEGDLREWLPSSETFSDSERREVMACMDALRDMRPLHIPTDRKHSTMEAPFAFEEWMFAWLYVPELMRWELAPLGHR